MNFLKKFKKDTLQDCDPNKIPYFSFEHLDTQCKVVYFYDGDSCTIVIKHNGKFVKLKCRLNGIDTPELRSSHGPEQFWARKVKDYVSQYNSKILRVKFYHFDKYGRCLIELFDDETGNCINNDLVKQNMAYRYDGKTKKPFLEWFKLRKI